MSYPRIAEALSEESIQISAVALDREHAVELAGQLLVNGGRVTPEYREQMVEVLSTHGPYFVIAPGIALAHAAPSEQVLQTGLSLLTLAEPIVFGHESNDPVELVIGMCAIDHDGHLDMLRELSEILSNEQIVNTLLNASDSEQIRSIL